MQRSLIVEDAVRRSRLEVLADSARRPGFARAAERFFAELEAAMVDPARFTRGLRDWAGDGPRRAYADEVAQVYRRYRDGLERAGLVDAELFAQRALEALVAEPERWESRPVFAYGFDDFTPLELAALEGLAAAPGTDVVVSLPFEEGREAFSAIATVHARLAELADRVEVLEAVSDHYAPGSKRALHALERGLFEVTGGAVAPGDAVRLHRAGGERAELELCGAEVLRLLRDGTPPGEVAVVLRDPPSYASLLEQVFGAYGIPYSIDRSLTLSHTGVGGGLLALLRAAGPEGTAEDLLTYLRTPGWLERPEMADRLELEARTQGKADAAGAREVWEQTDGRWRLVELDRVAAAGGGTRLLDELDRRLEQLFAGPYRRAAHVLNGAELDDARAFKAAREAIAELRTLAEADAELPLDTQRVHDTLAAVRVRVGESPQPDRVQVASPLQVRARRFEAVFVCGLQAAEFPRRAAPEAFLPDADRRAIRRVSGMPLSLREDQLERERYLFYVCISRAERLLVLSSRTSNEDGDPDPRSFFVEDACAVFAGLEDSARTRSLADVTWSLDAAPTEAEWERAVARQGPTLVPAAVGPVTAPAARAALDSRQVVSASALENYAGCPVKWLVENVLRPDKLEPDPEAMVRGSYAHKVLEVTFRTLRESTGSRRVTPDNLAEAERILLAALDERRGDFLLSPNQTRVRAQVRRLEFDLLRHLRHEAASDSLFEPEHLELAFGTDGSEQPALELEDGTRVRGVIDRVDTWNEYALVRDYKGGKVDTYGEAKWESERRLQAPLYMLAVEQAFPGLRAAGGVYVPLGGTNRKPRGLLAADLAGELGGEFSDKDFKTRAELEEHTARVRGQVVEVAGRMRSGELASCPDTCAYRGGCSYPSICRAEG